MRWLLVAACVACGCGTGPEPTPDPGPPCEKLCQVRDRCGLATTTCAQDCAWLDDDVAERAGCGDVTQLLDCVLASPTRLECADDGAVLDLAGCPGHPAHGRCVPLGSIAMAGFQLAADPVSSCPGELQEVSVGSWDPANHDSSVFDGLQSLLNDLDEPSATLPEGTVRCAIDEERPGVFDVSAYLRSGSAALSLSGGLRMTGETSPKYRGEADISYQMADGALFVKPPATPCLLTALDVGDVQTGAVWAELDCPWLRETADSPACRVTGSVLFENCTGL